MKTLIKLIVMPVAAYLGLGWAADNPMKTKFMMNKVDNKVEQGYEFALFQFKSFSSEPAPTQKKKGAYKERNKRNKRIRTAENTAYRNNYLKTHPCVDCGEGNPVVLEFDHVRGAKKKELSRMWTTGYALETIKEEIEKCEVRCRNCHAIKTAKQQGWNK